LKAGHVSNVKSMSNSSDEGHDIVAAAVGIHTAVQTITEPDGLSMLSEKPVIVPYFDTGQIFTTHFHKIHFNLYGLCTTNL